MSRGGGGVRITGGAWRGRRIRVPATARPTTERAREAIWSRWQRRVEGANCLELYAGSGVMSLEALSRGAARCTAVDQSGAAVRQLRRHSEELNAELNVMVATLPTQWPRVARWLAGPVDLVFLDPPYKDTISDGLLRQLADVLAPDGRIAVEHAAREELTLPENLVCEDSRRYGETAVTFLRQP